MKKSLLLLCTVLIFTACSKDDASDANERFKTLSALSELENNMLGSWKMTSYEASSTVTQFGYVAYETTQIGKNLDYSFAFYNDLTYDYGGSFTIETTTDLGYGDQFTQEIPYNIPDSGGSWEDVNGEIVIDSGVTFADGANNQITQDGIVNDFTFDVNGNTLTVLVVQTYSEPGVQLVGNITQTYLKQ